MPLFESGACRCSLFTLNLDHKSSFLLRTEAMKAAFIYSSDFSTYDYGQDHPLKPFRLKLTCELIRACGLLASPDPRLVNPRPAKPMTWRLFMLRAILTFSGK